MFYAQITRFRLEILLGSSKSGIVSGRKFGLVVALTRSYFDFSIVVLLLTRRNTEIFTTLIVFCLRRFIVNKKLSLKLDIEKHYC